MEKIFLRYGISLVVFLFFFTFVSTIVNGQQVLNGHIPSVIKDMGLKSIGNLDSTIQLEIGIGLPLRNQSELNNMLQDIYNPASPNYRHYLSVEEFTAEFGATSQDCQAVVAFAKANNLSVTNMFKNNLLIDLQGKEADIERALHVKMLVYNHPTENRTFFAPNRDPSVNLTVPVLQISGLDSYPSLHFAAESNKNSKKHITSTGTGSGPDSTFMGYDFRKAYAPGVTLDGSGQTLGLLEFGGYDTNDVHNYRTTAGLPYVALSNEPVAGFDGVNHGHQNEICLDIEMAISMAPGLAKIIVYEAPTNYGTDLGYFGKLLNQMASDNSAKQLSSSVAVSNYTTDAISDVAFLEMQIQGQSFFQASGDYDADNYYDLNGKLATSISTFPCADPYITVVGGTNLITSGIPNETWSSETVWNSNPSTPLGSAGGYDSINSIPIWQQSTSMSANGGSTQWRNIPDVAIVASNVYVYWGGYGHTDGAGTSCAAPLWAGFMALVNQNLAAHGSGSAGFINPQIYSIGNSSRYAYDFHDIPQGGGNNIWPHSGNNFSAVNGYDLCTGWGTPNGQNLINDFAAWNGIINIDNNFTIPSGKILTISPGTTINVGNGATFTVIGTLYATGTAANPITFNFGLKNPSTQNGIIFKPGSSGSSISYCKIRNAYKGFMKITLV